MEIENNPSTDLIKEPVRTGMKLYECARIESDMKHRSPEDRSQGRRESIDWIRAFLN